MKWGNASLYLLGGLLVLGPVGVRMMTWPAPQEQPLDTAQVKEGRTLFLHEFKPNDPLCSGGDGLGPVFNANSCVACHGQGGVGGSGSLAQNVITYMLQPDDPRQPPRTGMIHHRATDAKYQERFASIDADMPRVMEAIGVGSGRGRAGGRAGSQANRSEREPFNFVGRLGQGTVQVSERNAPALFGARLIDSLPDRVIIAAERNQRLRGGLSSSANEDLVVGRALRVTDGRVGKFGWKAQSASLAEFVQGACANELGLSNPGAPQPRPLGQPDYKAPGLDLTLDQCNQMTTFIASLDRPSERLPQDPLVHERATAGKRLFTKVGCAECHTPNLGSIEGIYSDLLLHRMGADLQSASAYYEPVPRDNNRPGSPGEAPLPDEWRTPPLWGVADSGPYLHDGRARTLEEAITMHGGQAKRSAQRFRELSETDQGCVVDFLKTLRAPSAN